MFKWPGVPTPRAPEVEVADFAELICWQQGSTSLIQLAQSLSRLAENDYSGGVPEEEEIPKDVESAFQEIERRIGDCDGGYPFDIDEHGNSLHVTHDTRDSRHIIYKYLLLATRLNMNDSRRHADIDGTDLLECLAAEAARQYLGTRAESMVFGTAEDANGFSDKVDELCKRLGEGGGFRNQGGGPLHHKDDKLDVVAWTSFADRRDGKLIFFGQCKTGTNWKDRVTQLQPDKFCSKWFETQPAVHPVRTFFVSEALSSVGWRNSTVDAGLLFDRCRIVDFSGDVSEQVLDMIATWTDAAAQASKLPGL